jgi:hypothetical protein
MLWWIMQNVILVAVAVSLICRWKRLSPAVRHALWLVVLIKLLTPPLFVWPWGIPVSAETFTEVVNVKQDLSQPEAILFEEFGALSSETVEFGDLEFPETDGLIVSSETFVVPLNTGRSQQKPSDATSVLPEMQSRRQAEQHSVWKFDTWIFRGSVI